MRTVQKFFNHNRSHYIDNGWILFRQPLYIAEEVPRNLVRGKGMLRQRLGREDAIL